MQSFISCCLSFAQSNRLCLFPGIESSNEIDHHLNKNSPLMKSTSFVQNSSTTYFFQMANYRTLLHSLRIQTESSATSSATATPPPMDYVSTNLGPNKVVSNK